MRQVLFEIPIEWLAKSLPDWPLPVYLAAALVVYGIGLVWQRQRAKTQADSKVNVQSFGLLLASLLVFAVVVKFVAISTKTIPVYGYGAMLFVAFVACWLLAHWLSEKEGMHANIADLALWIFVFGIIGGRVTYMIQYRQQFNNILQFFTIWEGGLVFYGAAFGGVIGFIVAYFAFLKKQGVSAWKMVDVIAPCGALGLCLGRVGCLLNGCCYGDVACPDCPAITFPLSAAPRTTMVARAHQTVAGFTLTEANVPTVDKLEADSAAVRAGLKPGDIIVKMNEVPVDTRTDLEEKLSSSFWGKNWRGQNDLQLTARRGTDLVSLPAFSPRTIGLHPTQIYETISMALLVLLLLAFMQVRRHDGAVMVLFMFAYAAHRFLNEMLRTDTDAVAFNMTLSQNISIIVALCGLLMMFVVMARPPRAPLAV